MVETPSLPASPTRFLGREERREPSDGGSDDGLARICINKVWIFASDDAEVLDPVAAVLGRGAGGAASKGWLMDCVCNVAARMRGFRVNNSAVVSRLSFDFESRDDCTVFCFAWSTAAGVGCRTWSWCDSRVGDDID